MPLDPYIFERPGQVSADTRAQWALAQKCVQRFGLVYTPPQPDFTPEGLWDRPLGPESEAQAKEWGYHQKPTDNFPDEQLSPDVSAVAFGNRAGVPVTNFAGQPVPEGGCFGEAQRKLAEGLPPVSDEQYALELASQAVAAADNDGRLQKAYASWSQCMKKAGYDYANPREAMQDDRFSAPPAAGGSVGAAAPPGQGVPQGGGSGGTQSPPSALEIATAVADVTCKSQTGLMDTWVAVVTEYQQKELDKHAAALAELQTALEARYKRAAEIVNGG